MKEVYECGICGFDDSQESIVETPHGFFHRECLDDQEADNKNYDPQKEMDEYVEQEISSHNHQ